MRQGQYPFRRESLCFAGLEKRHTEGVQPKETPMTALTIALTRLYKAFVETRTKQVEASLRRHKYIQ
jgi:hypothetical protein